MTAGPRIHRLVATVFSFGRVAKDRAPLEVADIHHMHADFVFRSLQRLGVRPSDLEDALQDVFVVVHRRLRSFDGSSRLTTWLYGICLRVATAHRRKAHLRRERVGAETEETADPDPGSNPEDVLARRQARDRLGRVLERLPAERRAVFVMFEIEGLGADEIADMMGVPVGTVYSRLSKARKEFERALRRLESSEAAREAS